MMSCKICGVEKQRALMESVIIVSSVYSMIRIFHLIFNQGIMMKAIEMIIT